MKVYCPDDCIYRQKDAPVCGFCLIKILADAKVEETEGGVENGQKSEDKST